MDIIRKNSKIIYIVMFLVAVLLYLRDVRGIYISKNIFLLMIVPVLFLSSIKDGLTLWFFLMPLYVGLPGNYITLIILFKFLLFQRIDGRIKIYKIQFILTIFFALFIFIQNIYYGYFGIYYMIFIVELFVVYFLVTTELNEIFPKLILFYSLGICLTGLIMLFYTLRFYNLIDLLNVATRLGYVGKTEKMSVLIDPNYYGLFSITSISCNYLFILRNKYTFYQKIIGIISTIICLNLALIGMSRAFVLCLILFIILLIIFQRKKINLIIFTILCIFIISYLFPDVVQGIIERFSSSDIKTGNGRIGILKNMLEQWSESIYTIIFGIGLFNCNAHFMHMQYFIGCGLLGSSVIAGLGISYFKFSKNKIKKIKRDTYIPIILTQISATSIPIAYSLTFMMPIIVSLLVFGNINEKRRKYKDVYKKNYW